MSLDSIVEEFQNYEYNSTKIISSSVKEELRINKNSNRDILEIKKYMLHEIITLLNKSILNRLSFDILFQKNYWSWGFVTLYYSNFFLAQTLNRLKGNFFTQVPEFKRRNIYLDSSDNEYKSSTSQDRDIHKAEFEKLRENYIFLLEDYTINSSFRKAIPDDYTSPPYFNESYIRNNINYKLSHYRELTFNDFKEGYHISDCIKRCNGNNNIGIDEFKLLDINNSRFNLLFDIIGRIKDNNSHFENKYNIFLEVLKDRFIENYYHTNIHFHKISENLKRNLKGWLNEL